MFEKQTFTKPLTWGEVARLAVTERADCRKNCTKKPDVAVKKPSHRLAAELSRRASLVESHL
jgi:hypothetical protein